MHLRRKILDKVFDKGVSSVPEKALESLFKKKFYTRYETEPETLLREGFNPKTSRDEGVGLMQSEPQGIYWNRPKNPHMYSDMGSQIKGIPNPKSKWYNLPIEEYKRELLDTTKGREYTGKIVKKGYDFIKYKDFKGDDYEVVQIKPNSMLAKIGSKYKILGLAGLGLGASLIPFDSAEAVPIKPVKPVGFQVRDLTKGPSDFLSEAANFLVGKTLPSGAKIINVQYPHEGSAAARNFRRISFSLPDGSVSTKDMSKEAIFTLCSSVGYTNQMEKFTQLHSPIKKTDMLKASLEQRKKVGLTGTVPKLRQKLSDYIAKAEIVNPGVNIDEAQVRWGKEQINLPRKYINWALKSGKKSKIPYVSEAFEDLKPLYGGKPVKPSKLPYIQGGGTGTGEPFKIENDYIILYKEKKGQWKVTRVNEDTYKKWNSIEGQKEAKLYNLTVKTTKSEIEDILLKQQKNPYTRIKYE